MATIQIVLEPELIKAADQAAKRRKVNRSALIREALREHLHRLHVLELEARDRRGYEAVPQAADEYLAWEDVASWPEEYRAATSGSADLRRRTRSGLSWF